MIFIAERLMEGYGATILNCDYMVESLVLCPWNSYNIILSLFMREDQNSYPYSLDLDWHL